MINYLKLIQMRKIALIILVTLIGLSSCNHKREQSVEPEELITQEFIDSIIFHGYTVEVASARYDGEGNFTGWSELQPYRVKYALYLEHGEVAIFSDSAQFHIIEEYLGKIEGDRYACYALAVIDQNEELGYLKFNYQNNGVAQLYVDYPDTLIVYTLDHGYMPQETLERKLQKFGGEQTEEYGPEYFRVTEVN